MNKIIILILFLFTKFAYSQNEILIDGEPCGIHGSARENTMEYRQNVFKNRNTIPSPQDIDKSISLNKLLQGGVDNDRFNQNQAAEITGYVFDVKTGGIESCNCKTSSKQFRDTHIEITPNDRETDASKRLIVEVTPRLREIMSEKGIDWSTEQLKSMKGRTVKIEGWMFYDSSHQNEAYSNDPENNIGKKNWRATCWEIHPVTGIETIDALAEEYPEEESGTNLQPFNYTGSTPTNGNTKKTMETTNTPLNTLIIILLGAVLGMVGQGLRVIVGLKKVFDKAANDKSPAKDLIEYKRLALSLFIAFSIGSVAGVLAAIAKFDISYMNKSTLIAFITAGYVGTDFIEGVFRQIIPPSAKNQ
jgi:hypothetical protein